MKYLFKKIEDLKVELKAFIINTPSVRRRRTDIPFKKGEFKDENPIVACMYNILHPFVKTIF